MFHRKERRMNARIRISLVTALCLLATAPLHAQTYGPEDEGRRFSDGSRVVCRDVDVTQNTRDPNRIAGTVVGAVVGGAIGNQIGDGKGRKLATVGGAVAGGAIGRNIQGNRQEERGQRSVERVCERVY
jgi:uncharacterized protein YcfJ